MFEARSWRQRGTRLALAAGFLFSSCAGEPPPARPRPAAVPRGPRTVDGARRPRLDAEGVLQGARSSVVVVESLDRRRNLVAQGSGVVVADKTVVTAWPLVSRAFAIRVVQNDEARPATIAAVLEGRGLVRLRTAAMGPVGLGRDATPSPGSSVFAIGSAQGLEMSVAEGIASGVREGKGGGERIETTVSLPAGLTGGGLFDVHGELIGITTSARAGDTHTLAVPVRYVKDLLALPEGTLPRVASSPLQRLPAADRQWLIDFMAGVARGSRPLAGLGLDRVNALLDRLDPLVGAELDRVKVELGLGFLGRERLFWEDAIEARAFGRAVKSARRAEVEKALLALRILTPRDIAEGDRMMRSIAARESFDLPGARVEANERFLAQMVTRTDQTRRGVETQLWEARSR